MSYPYQIRSLEEYHEAYSKSINDPESFWADIAKHFLWKRPWSKVLEWDFETPKIEWFKGGTLNITENCLDRHLETLGKKPAIIWEPNDTTQGRCRTISYEMLHSKVCRFANVLKHNGVKKSDRVCIYMGMIPELAVAMLACARIGAIHSVIFGGFSAQSIIDRMKDAQAEYMITCNIALRGSKTIPLKAIVDEALNECPFVKRVIVYNRTNAHVPMQKDRDVFWNEEMKIKANNTGECPAEEMDAEDPLFILYTSGSTGKPKGVVHSSAGYMVYTNYTFVNVFQYTPGDVFFCTADAGWITGHSYGIYGPLSAGAATVMFEGVPTWPDAGRLWKIIEKNKVNTLYMAPTTIRSLMAYGTEPLKGKNLSSLKVLGSVGEPINEEAWRWYRKYVGGEKCHIVDTWWQTETGGILLSNLAGITPEKSTYTTWPLPGVQPVIVNENYNSPFTGEIQQGACSGNLCIKAPWPAMIRTTYGDHERCRKNYFTKYPQLYFTGDGCLRDEDGNYKITGRVDDVLNVSGHRIGTAEIENAINMHKGIIESAVVGYRHNIKGEGIFAYVVYNSTQYDEGLLIESINITVSRIIGSFAKPDKIQIVQNLPKTRSGKIMRRILRNIAEGEKNVGDITTLLDPAVVEEIREGYKKIAAAL